MVETDISIGSASSRGGSSIEVVDPCGIRAWDSATAHLAGVSIFHTAAWARVLTETYGYKAVYFVQRNAHRIRGVLPLMSIRTCFAHSHGVSLPFTDFCPIVADDAESQRRLFQSAVEYADRVGWRYLEFRGGDAPTSQAMPAISYVEHVIPLTDEDTMFKRLRSEARTAVRRGEQAGVRVVIGSDRKTLEYYYDLHCLTRKRHGLPPQPFSFFLKIYDHLIRDKLGSVFLAYYKQRPIAGAVFLHRNHSVVYKFGASDSRLQHLRGNNCVFWEALKTFARQGYRYLRLGRTSVANHGLRRFKRSWGAEERELKYFCLDLRSSKFILTGDSSVGWHNTIFRLLPVRLNCLIGRVLYRHLA